MNSSLSPFLSLSDVIRGLRESLGGWSVLGWLSTAVTLLVHRRLGQICVQMERMAARHAAGRLWRPGPRVAPVSPGVTKVDRVRRQMDAPIWPRSFGWLVQASGWQAAGYGVQLRAVLARPEMVALLVAAPQAVRVLRPLCRMLAIETSVLRPAWRREAVEPVQEEPPTRVRRPRATPSWGRVPIPRGVRAWVRRERVADG